MSTTKPIDPRKYAAVRRLGRLGTYRMLGPSSLVAVDSVADVFVLTVLTRLAPGDRASTSHEATLTFEGLARTADAVLEVRINQCRSRIEEIERELVARGVEVPRG